jgi:predicted protein tyrosine phosphatase
MKARRTRNPLPLDIRIRDEGSAALYVQEQPDTFHVISIRDFKAESAPVDRVAKLCRSMLVLRFNDLRDVHLNRLTTADMAKYGLHYPEKEHVEAALDYAKDKLSLLVHCTAGVSRSSAMAYVIACSRVVPSDALRVLDSKFHWPNDRVVRLGAEILGDPEIVRAVKEWKSALESE